LPQAFNDDFFVRRRRTCLSAVLTACMQRAKEY